MEVGNSYPSPSAREPGWWVVDPRQSLRARAVFIFSASAAAFVLLLIWIAGVLLHRDLEQQAGRSYETLAFQISDKLDRALFERTRELQFAASLLAFHSPETPAAERRQLVEAIQTTSTDYAWVGIIDYDGKVEVATQRLYEGESRSNQIWFRAARDKPFVGNLHEDLELTRATSVPGSEPLHYLDVAVPITRAGQWMGFLVGQWRWTAAREIQLSVVPENIRRENLNVTIYASNHEVLLDSGGSGWTEPPKPPSPPDRARNRGFLREQVPEGTNYFTGYARTRGYRDFRGLNWLVVVRHASPDVFAPVRHLRLSLARWGIAFVVIIGISSWFFATQFTRRLRALAAAADRIRSGDTLALMPLPRGPRELAHVCSAIGELIEDLRRGKDPDRK